MKKSIGTILATSAMVAAASFGAAPANAIVSTDSTDAKPADVPWTMPDASEIPTQETTMQPVLPDGVQAMGAFTCDGGEGSPGTTICITTQGPDTRGLYVDDASISMNYLDIQQRCGVKVSSWGTTPSGQPASRQTAIDYDCFGVGWNDVVDWNRTFKDGSLLYGQAYWDGAWRGGIAGIGIHA
ncbi:hypothetical protein ACFFON_06630 [Arthrobacter citreus]|uniref:hypothetical protein n=1 Tax=Arthrobacter TaxID=1663 RepID=UPI001264331E|nr:hypothetical protein [Arthrobacter gandavensis]